MPDAESIMVSTRKPQLPPSELLPPRAEEEPEPEPPPTEQRTPKFALMISGSPGDPQRYRCTHKVEELGYLGLTADSIDFDRKRDHTRLIPWYDLFLLHRVQNLPNVESFIRGATAAGKTVVYDTDDLIFDMRPEARSPLTRRMRPNELRSHEDYIYRNHHALGLSSAAIVTTERLHDTIKELWPEKPVYVHRNAVSAKFVELAATVRTEFPRTATDAVRIAYISGSKTHQDDFAQCLRPLRDLLRKYPNTRLMVVGHLDVPEEMLDLTGQIETVPFVPWYQVPGYYGIVDINIAPLELNNRFNESKSELKYFEAAFMELPTIASDIAPFRVGIEDGVTGFLCSTEDQWFLALENLVLDAELRRRIGQAALEDAMRRYTTRARSEQLAAILAEIGKGAR